MKILSSFSTVNRLLALVDSRSRLRANSASAFCLSPKAPPPWILMTSAPTHSATSAWYSISRIDAATTSGRCEFSTTN